MNSSHPDPLSPPRAVLGVDISKACFDAVLVLENGQRHAGRFDNNPAGFAQLQRWLHRMHGGTVHAGLEATGRYGLALAYWLHERHHWVCLLNPYRVKAYGTASGKRNKTDRADAELIAEFIFGLLKHETTFDPHYAAA